VGVRHGKEFMTMLRVHAKQPAHKALKASYPAFRAGA
jgi:hypothetical protein